jgi:hypothetical protein
MPLKDNICSSEEYILFQKKLLEKSMESATTTEKPPHTPSPSRRFRTIVDKSRNSLNLSRNGLLSAFERSPLSRSRNGMDRSWSGMNRSRNGGMDGSRNGLDRSRTGLSPQDEGEYGGKLVICLIYSLENINVVPFVLF